MCKQGTAFGGFKSRSEVPPLIDDYEEGKLQLDHYITHRFEVKYSCFYPPKHSAIYIRAMVDTYLFL